MSHSVKVAISLPETLFAAVERERRHAALSRSQVFRLALEAFLRRCDEQRAVEQYLKGYRDHPESEQEIDAIHEISVDAVASEAWD